MNWLPLENPSQLETLVNASHQRPQVIFKYSSICDLSESVKDRLEEAKQPTGIDFHFLDLIRLRPLSNQVAEDFKVKHQSPQVLLVIKGECIYHESHTKIRMDAIEAESMTAL